MDEYCIFKRIYGDKCDLSSRFSSNSGSSRIHSIIAASNIYADGLASQLETQLTSNPDLKVYYHKNCVSKYTSKTNYAALIKTTTLELGEGPSAKRLRHTFKPFDFKLNCLYCGEQCDVNKSRKNPSRWRPAFMCRSTHTEYGSQPYTEYLLEKCDARGDTWGSDLRNRIQGA